MVGENEMERVFRVIRNSRFGHGFRIGELVTLEIITPDRNYIVKSTEDLDGREISQYVHPSDVEKVVSYKEDVYI